MLVVLVDPGPWFKERLHEQVQEGRYPDLRRHTRLDEQEREGETSGQSTRAYGRSEGTPRT